MRIKNIFKLASKDIKREKRSIWLCALGIGVGIWLLVLTVSFGEGIKKEIEESISSMTDLNIVNIFYPNIAEAERMGLIDGPSSALSTKKISESTIKEIESLPEVEMVYRSYHSEVIFELGGIEVPAGSIIGIPLEVAGSIKKSQVIEGKFLEKENEITLDSGTAEVFEVFEEDFKKLIGKEITVTPFYRDPKVIYDDDGEGRLETYLSPRKFKIAGIIEANESVTNFYASSSYIHFDTAQEIYKEMEPGLKPPSLKEAYEMMEKEYEDSSEFDSLSEENIEELAKDVAKFSAENDTVPFVAKIFVKDRNNVKKTIEKLEKMGFATKSSQSIIEEINKMIFIVEIVLSVFGIIALFASIFGIVNVMYLMVSERKKEIGILKAIGAKRSDISFMFLIEGGMMGLAGGLIGIFCAFFTGKIFSFIINQLFFSGIEGGDIWGMDIPQISTFIPFWLFVLALLTAVFFSILAALAPAERASKIKTVDVLRQG